MLSRLICTAVVALFVVSGSTFGQEWARKMFETADHDFGTVARGADVVFKFPIKNIYKEDSHIQSVRSSCGCTDPSIENDTLKTYDVGYIVAKFNTRTFTGPHSATLTVTIDKPYPAQVQLRVHGNIRGDVVFEPGSLKFDSIEQGEQAERKVSVRYAGRPGWKVSDVVVATEASDMFAVELTETERNGGRVTYDLLVRLKPTAPPGFIRNELVLVTNDPSSTRIPLDVEGRIVPDISASPEDLVYGDVTPGATVSKKIVIRGKDAFRITGIDAGTAPLKFDYTNDEKTTHIVNVTLNAPDKAGKWKQAVKVTTSLGETYVASLNAYATVAEVAPDKPEPEASMTSAETSAKSSTAASTANPTGTATDTTTGTTAKAAPAKTATGLVSGE